MKRRNNKRIHSATWWLRSILPHVAPVILLGFLLSACGGGGGGGGSTTSNQPAPAATSASLAVVQVENAASPVIAAATGSNGSDAVVLTGTKDSSGAPLGVNQALYIAPSGAILTLQFGADGLPMNLSDSVGNKLVFSNFTNSTVDVALFDPAGNEIAGPITVDVNPAVLAAMKAAAPTLASTSTQASSVVTGATSLASAQGLIPQLSAQQWVNLALPIVADAIGDIGCGAGVLAIEGGTAGIGTPVGVAIGVGCVSETISQIQQITRANPVPAPYTYAGDAASCIAYIGSVGIGECAKAALDLVMPVANAAAPGPVAPTGLDVIENLQNKVYINWQDSASSWDALAGYRVYRNGIQVADIPSPGYLDINVAPGKNYCYTVEAHDVDGKPSSMSPTLCVTTPNDALYVGSTTPVNDATGTSVGSAVYATFNDAINESTLNTSTFTLNGPSGAVAGTVSYDATTNSAVFTPTTNLASGEQYTATITAGVTNTSGNSLASNYSWTFTTEGNPTTTAGAAPLSFTSLVPGTLSTNAAPYQATLTAYGSNFTNLAQVHFVWSGATSGSATWVKGTTSWDPSKISVYSDGLMTLKPTVTQAGDPSGTTTWTVTLTDTSGENSSQTFTVYYAPPSTAPGSFSLSANAYCNMIPPIAPAVMLSWTASSGVSSYDLYQNGSLSVAATNITGTSFDNDLNVSAGQTYTYYVVAKNSVGTTQSNVLTVAVPLSVCGGSTAPLSFSSLSPASVSTGIVGYQPTLTASGANFTNVEEIGFDWSGVTNGSATWVKGDTNWNNKVVLESDSSMTLAPVVTQLSDPAGITTWNVTLTDSTGATETQTFTVNYTPPVSPAPVISSVSPNPVTGSNSNQPFYIYGSNFVSGANIILRDLTAGQIFQNRVPTSFTSTGIALDPDFTTAPDNWSVEVINPDGQTTGQIDFSVVQ